MGNCYNHLFAPCQFALNCLGVFTVCGAEFSLAELRKCSGYLGYSSLKVFHVCTQAHGNCWGSSRSPCLQQPQGHLEHTRWLNAHSTFSIWVPSSLANDQAISAITLIDLGLAACGPCKVDLESLRWFSVCASQYTLFSTCSPMVCRLPQLSRSSTPMSLANAWGWGSGMANTKRWQ